MAILFTNNILNQIFRSRQSHGYYTKIWNIVNAFILENYSQIFKLCSKTERTLSRDSSTTSPWQFIYAGNIHTYIHTHTYVCTHVCMYACMYVRLYVDEKSKSNEIIQGGR